MRLNELFALMENDSEHAQALQDTGFWGKQGAGSIPLARSTKRFLIAHRSDANHAKMLAKGAYRGHDWRGLIPEQPGTWGTWGGAIDPGENPQEAAARELAEEAGHLGHLEMFPLYVFRKKVPGGTFRYSNFLAVVDDEFDPVLNWETQGYRWCEFGQWPQPLHFGLEAVLKDGRSRAMIEKVLAQLDVADQQPD